jgi:HSP20 family protein
MLSRFDPFQEMTTLRRAMDDLVERSLVRPWWGEEAQARVAPVDVQENDQGYTVRVAVPGFKPEDLDVTVQQNMLTIRGRRRQEEQEGQQQQRNWVRREIRAESFERSLSFDRQIDPDRITSSYEHGILTLTIPTHPTAQARHIQITGGQQIPSLQGGKPQQ